MPAKHRPNPKTQATCFRVYRIPEPLRKAMNQKRKKWGQTVYQFIGSAVTHELPRLIEGLNALGIMPTDPDARPAKLPLDEQVLMNLKKANEETGVPQTTLLLGALQLTVNRKRRPTQRKGRT